jgi:ribosomal protein S18 acetylase RimI-like enzyme
MYGSEVIVQARFEDAETILDLQKLAYRSEAAIYDDYSIAPLTQTIQNLRSEFDAKTFLKVVIGDRIVGSVRAYQMNHTCYVERLIVHPDLQRRGLGTKLLKRIEKLFRTADRFELFTGHRSESNIRLYSRLGYRIFKRESVTERLSFVYMEKRSSAVALDEE